MADSSREGTKAGMEDIVLDENKDIALKVLKGVIENSRDVISAVGPDLRYIAFNSAYRRDFKRVFGRDVEPGASVDELLPDLLPQGKIAKAFWKRALEGESFSVSQEFGDEAKGERNYFEINYGPVRDEGGKVIAASVIAHNATQRERAERELRRLKDELEERVRLRTRELEESGERLRAQIEERKKAEKALLRERELLQTVINTIPIMITIYDPQILKFQVNKELERVTGWTNEDFQRINPMEAVYPDPAYRQMVTEYVRSLAPGFKDLVMTAKDGSCIETSWANIKLPDGRQVGIGLDIRERKKAEEELRRNDEIIRNINSVILTTDRNGTITYINDFGLGFFGYARDELVGKNVIGTIVPKTESTGRDLQKMVSEIMSNPDNYRANVNENIRKNGERVWVSWSNRTMRDDTGNIAGTFTAGNDITELIKVQKEAAEDRRILLSIMRNIKEGITIADAPDGKIRLVSDYGVELIGKPKDELVGIPAETRPEKWGFYEKDGKTLAKPDELPLHRAMKNGETVTGEEWFIKCPDGGMRTFSFSASPIRDADNNLVGAVSGWRDITEAKKTEETLRRNEYELKSVVENTPDIYFRLNRQFQYVFVNPTYERLTGLMKEQFIGKTNDQLGMTRQMAQFWESAAREVFESGKECAAEFEISGFFGRRYFSARLIPEFEKSGLVETVLAVARDVTDQKRAEDEIAALKK